MFLFLVQAALDNKFECLSYLVEHLDDLDTEDFMGNTALELAEKSGNEYAIRIIQQALEMRERDDM